MCGIVGKIYWRSGASPNPDVLGRMTDQLKHRGPDERGTWVKGPVGLGMRRLKVMDLKGGQQPMTNTHCPVHKNKGAIHLVYNGEIYGFRPLRQQLEAKGHVFHSTSDTEVLLHGWEEWQDGLWDKIDGMFAVALYEEATHTLTLARDRMGIKPLYYRNDPVSFAFASEIKALLSDPDTPRHINPQAVSEFFSLRYVPTPRSIYKDIYKCEPGHLLKVKDGTVQEKAYWSFTPQPSTPRPLSYYLEQLDALMHQAIKDQLVSDAPLGIFLSGGLDSSTIAYYVHKENVPLDSFTVTFGSKGFSERDEARATAQRFNLRHNELEVTDDVSNLESAFGQIFDEPFADPSIIPTYHLCQWARRKVTVCLSGDGGDELLGGYPTYVADRLAKKFQHLPGWVKTALHKTTDFMPVSFGKTTWDYRWRAFLAAADRSQPLAHFGWQEMFREREKPHLFAAEFWAQASGLPAEESFVMAYGEGAQRDEWERLLHLDQRTHLMDEYLVKVDRLSMAHSLEVRVPLLQRSLVEFAAGIPFQYKIRGWTTKYILRKLMTGRLPRRVIHAPKSGFSPPLAHWLAGPLKDWAAQRLSPERVEATKILNPRYPQELLSQHVQHQADHSRRLWTLLSFMAWYDKYGQNHSA